MSIESHVSSVSKIQPSKQSNTLAGWGRYPRLSASIYNPDTLMDLRSCIEQEIGHGLLARGLGRSYGDAALSSESRILITNKLNRMLGFDAKTGTVRCEPGVSFADLISTFLPKGWFPPVTPGTKFVTMGGALASDIHGKNHHVDGSFVDFVSSFKLITANDEHLDCSRDHNSELFWATAGGMGLTGIITQIEVRLRPVSSQYQIVKKLKCANLAETFNAIEANERNYQYSVSWIDALAGGSNLGRSILMLGRHAIPDELPLEMRSLENYAAKKALTIPADMPSWLLNRYSIGAFNAVYYNLSAKHGEEKITHFDPFFYPLDSLSDWNRMYGKAGFIQYQCVLPLESSKEGMEEILALSCKRGRSSFLAVLKKFGAGHGLLSFPMAGYTLCLDVPVKPGLLEFTKELDRLVIKYGGRVYLAKDACLSPEDFRAMYPELDKWLSIKKLVDPNYRFSSALAKRLGL